MRCSSNRFLYLVASALALAFVLNASSPADAQTNVPRLEPAECPFARGDWSREATLECKSLIVPEARGNPKTRTIKLAVVILRARQPDGTPPFVFLHGGPGDSAIQRVRGFVQSKAYENRDIVIYDQRAAGYSEPKLCPEFKDVHRGQQNLKTQKEIEDFTNAGIRKCVASLDTRIDRSAYNTRESAADMIDLRKALGYSSWGVVSDSYGARIAQEALRRDTDVIHSLVLNKPVTRGPEREGEVALFNQHAFERVFKDCLNQTECHTAFPTLEKDFYKVYDDLNNAPILIPDEQNPNVVPVVLDGARFVERIRNDVISPANPERLARLPLLINEFRRGDKTRAARTLVSYNPRALVGSDSVLVNLMSCADVYSSQLRSKRRAVNRQVRAPFRRDLMEDCKLWQKRFANPSDWQPVRSDVPTLILTGRYDDRTPTELAKRIAATFTRSYLYELPNEGHGPPPIGCHAQLILQFLANPLREPDASCIKSIAPIRFLTEWQEPGVGP
jgi:pimeloyl-ACP methyl ester carboxylesterase